jgi:hypothetical protein
LQTVLRRNDHAMTRSEERAAKNEAAFRQANEKIDARRRSLGLNSRTPYLCECEDERCIELVRLTPSEYLQARSEPRHFVVASGHEPRERVLDRSAEYVLVEKTGRGGQIAQESAE